jgi:hypothetical protein
VIVAGSILTEFWRDQLSDNSRQGLFLVLVGFLVSFGFIRLSTRLMRSPRVPWWPGSIVSDGGVHIHHLVFGIGLMIGAGTLGFWFFDTHPWLEVCALVFGIGVGLTIDEFALLVHLDDVYWSEEGRSSIDATVVAVAAMILIFLGVRPFDIATGTAADLIGSIVFALLVLGLVSICFAKQRLWHGAFGFFIFPLALYAAVRLGKPSSPWARWRYGARNPGKQAEAEERFRPDRRTERLKNAFRDLVGGATKEVFEAKMTERAARAEATVELRRRADQVAAAELREGAPDTSQAHRDPRSPQSADG